MIKSDLKTLFNQKNKQVKRGGLSSLFFVFKISKMHNKLIVENHINFETVKKALNLMGYEVGSLRSPLTEMTEANAAKMAEVMKAYGLKLV